MSTEAILTIVQIVVGISLPPIGIMALFIVNGMKDEIGALKANLTTVNNGIHELNTTITTLIERDSNKNDRIKENRDHINEVKKEQLKLRDKMHDLSNSVLTKEQFGLWVEAERKH